MDLRTTWLGLELAHPIVASASPLSGSLDGVRKLEDGGAAAVVLHSLFEEQIRWENEAYEHLSKAGSESHAESMGYFPAVGREPAGPDHYLELVRRAREAVSVPVVASLNGVTDSGWTSFARLLQEAGAHALELNIFHVPSDRKARGRDVEERCEHIVGSVAAAVSIPITVKLSPFFSAPGEMAERLVSAGAQGLALFNRFYQPDIDLEKLEVEPSLELSQPWEMRLPLLWIAILRGRLRAALAATTGVEGPSEVVKYLLGGADVVMTPSALLRHGPGHLRTLVDGLGRWLEGRGCKAVDDVRGSMSQEQVPNPEAFERANYLRILQRYRSEPLRLISRSYI